MFGFDANDNTSGDDFETVLWSIYRLWSAEILCWVQKIMLSGVKS
jgi:hypothetical protein